MTRYMVEYTDERGFASGEFDKLAAIYDAVQAAYYDDNGGLDGVNALLGTVEVGGLSEVEMIAYLRYASSGHEEMPNHARLLKAVADELRRRGYDEEASFMPLLMGFMIPK
jgi:hypothetical protein